MLSAIFTIFSNTVVSHGAMFLSGAFIGKAYLEHVAAAAKAALPTTVAQMKAQAAPVVATVTAATPGVLLDAEKVAADVASKIEAKL